MDARSTSVTRGCNASEAVRARSLVVSCDRHGGGVRGVRPRRLGSYGCRMGGLPSRRVTDPTTEPRDGTVPPTAHGTGSAPAGSIGESTIVGSNSRPSRTAGPLRQSSLLCWTLRLSPLGTVGTWLIAFGFCRESLVVSCDRQGGEVRGVRPRSLGSYGCRMGGLPSRRVTNPAAEPRDGPPQPRDSSQSSAVLRSPFSVTFRHNPLKALPCTLVATCSVCSGASVQSVR